MSAGVTFWVPGVPQPGGSKRGFITRTKTGGQRVAIVEDAKHNKAWRAVVALAASERFAAPLDGPLALTLRFMMPRPKKHYRTGRHAAALRDDAPRWHASKPDTTKLVRSTEDALTGIAWRDDAQVARQFIFKQYGDAPGCWITIDHLEEA